jgi:hypothetical protein
MERKNRKSGNGKFYKSPDVLAAVLFFQGLFRPGIRYRSRFAAAGYIVRENFRIGGKSRFSAQKATVPDKGESGASCEKDQQEQKKRNRAEGISDHVKENSHFSNTKITIIKYEMY